MQELSNRSIAASTSSTRSPAAPKKPSIPAMGQSLDHGHGADPLGHGATHVRIANGVIPTEVCITKLFHGQGSAMPLKTCPSPLLQRGASCASHHPGVTPLCQQVEGLVDTAQSSGQGRPCSHLLTGSKHPQRALIFVLRLLQKTLPEEIVQTFLMPPFARLNPAVFLKTIFYLNRTVEYSFFYLCVTRIYNQKMAISCGFTRHLQRFRPGKQQSEDANA